MARWPPVMAATVRKRTAKYLAKVFILISKLALAAMYAHI
jgi:hypothetical protein